MSKTDTPADYSLFDYTPVGMCVIDQNLKVQFWNSCLEDWSSIPREKMLGTDLRSFCPKLGEEYYLKRVESVLCGGTPVVFSPQLHSGLFPIRRYDGSPQVQHIKLTPLPETEARECHALFSIEDLTDLDKRIKDYRREHQTALTEISHRAQVEEELRKSLAEKDFLIKEIHHRVKNNLSLVAGLIGLQESFLHDGRDQHIFVELQNKIQSISLVHEKLYRGSDIEKINVKEYLEDLLPLLRDSSGRENRVPQVKMDIQSIILPIDTAIPLALIITELFLNALKYAFPDEKAGTIWIRFYSSEDDTCHLEVRDDGVGLPDNFDIETGDSLGFKLISNFVAQLRGKLEVGRSPSTSFDISFPRRITEKN